jgi:hypothetical protein
MHSPSAVSDHAFDFVQADLDDADDGVISAQTRLQIDWTFAFSALEGAQEALVAADTDTERAIRLDECKIRMVSNIIPSYLTSLG